MTEVEAQTQKITDESYTGNCYSSEKSAVLYINEQPEYDRIFVVRDREGVMINSYSWKVDREKWGTVNMSGYYGGYKIGNPRDCGNPDCWMRSCMCGYKLPLPDHPPIKS
jgi:hypothetical protein